VPGFSLVPASRVASLATGRGGLPAPEEWPFIGLLLVLVAVVGTMFLASVGLTKLEAAVLAGAGPLLVVTDVSLTQMDSGLVLAANVAGCILPILVGAKILAQRRAPWLEAFIVIGIGVVVSYFASHVVPARGVLLQYRVPAFAVGLAAAALLHKRPEAAGALAFVGGGLGVLLGADVLHLRELAAVSGAGRVILGGAGLLDGIFLVSVLAAGIAASAATMVRALVRTKRPAGAV
jgi:uncharacterized membrane protein